MKIGTFTIQEVLFGLFRLDGGCMFGSVPKNLWAREIPSDEENRIQLACRSLIIRGAGRVFLVDVGMGEKWSEKQKAIYAIQNTPRAQWGFDPKEVTDVVLTHLHFDHAGGITELNAEGKPVLAFPHATIHLQRANWEHAQNPTLKDRASYLPDNVTPLTNAKLTLYDGSSEIVPGLWVHRVDGHTKGQQWVEVRGERERLFFPTDLMPTSHHVSLPYHMGYDVCAETLFQEKEAFLKRAHSEGALICFEHDATTALAKVTINERGHYVATERQALP